MGRSVRLAIIGAGTAGMTAFREARRETDSVVLIEGGPGGTTCASTGCMPSKALLHAAHAWAGAQWLARLGLAGDPGRIDRSGVLERVRALRDRFVAGPRGFLDELGPQAVRGQARFVAPGVLETDAGERIETEATIIATGSEPVVPPGWEGLGGRLLTSDNLFEQPELPERLAVIGLGPIGLELGQALAQLGVEAVGYGGAATVGGLTDPEVDAAAREGLGRDWSLHTGIRAEVTGEGGGVKVTADGASARFDAVLAALGRRPRLAGLGLETLGIEPRPDAPLPLDPETLRLGEQPVYLAGDVAGLRPLQHEAADEGRLAAHHALHPDGPCLTRRATLAIVFCEPNLARVGCAFRELPEDAVVGRTSLRRQGRAVMADRDQGAIAVYAEAGSGRLLGAELAAPDGEHLAHLLAWAVQARLTVDDALQMPYYHPVVEEALRSALQDARQGLGRRRRLPDLPLCRAPEDWALGGDYRQG